MSDKPREWWLRNIDDNGQELELWWNAVSNSTHVIEYSAYESAKAEALGCLPLIETLTKERDEARAALNFYKGERDEDPKRWQYWRKSRADLLADYEKLEAKSAKLVEALEGVVQICRDEKRCGDHLWKLASRALTAFNGEAE